LDSNSVADYSFIVNGTARLSAGGLLLTAGPGTSAPKGALAGGMAQRGRAGRTRPLPAAGVSGRRRLSACGGMTDRAATAPPMSTGIGASFRCRVSKAGPRGAKPGGGARAGLTLCFPSLTDCSEAESF
jgi:hypothetical protein